MMNARGNIFLAMFAAVGLAGVIGFSTTQYIRGPVSASSDLTRKNVAQTELMIASQLAITAAGLQTSGGDCDSDGFVEPLRYRDAGVADKPVGGGYVPLALGTNKTDPWGVEYGYCVWDHGAQTLQASCQASGNDYRLAGGNVKTQPVLILVSAGPDRTFQTTCRAWADANDDGVPDQDLFEKAGGSDDIITHYTYTEAADLSGDLWSLKAGDPDTATISKDLEVGGGAAFTGTVSFNSGGLVLPDETGSGACNSANADVLRRNTTTSPPTLEVCVNDGSPAWESVSGGGGGGGGIVIEQKTTLRIHDYYDDNSYVSSQSFSTLPTAGNSILVAIRTISNTPADVANGDVVDNQGNTYTRIAVSGDAAYGQRVYLFLASNIGTPSGTFTITVTSDTVGSTAREAWAAMEISGLANSSVVDQTVTEHNSCLASETLTTGTTTQADELAIGFNFMSSDTMTDFTVSGGWTEEYRNLPQEFSLISQVLSATGTPSNTWTITSSGRYWCPRLMVTLKGSGSGGGGGGGAGTPGGNDTEVQYNDGGAFNGDTMFVWDETNNQLGVGSTTTYATLDLGSGTGQKLLSYADGSNGRSGLGANMGAASSYQTNLFGQNDGTNGNLSFGFVATADGTTYTERMRLTQAGRLGIGVTAPDAPLEVNGEVILGDSSLACDANREGGIKYDTSTDTVKFCDGAGTWANIDSGGGGGGGSGGVAGSSGEIQYNDEGSPGAEPDFIWNKTSNRVGIGRATPVSPVDINGAVIVGNDSTSCSATIKGAIRFNLTTSKLQYCNSSSWVTFMSSLATDAASVPSSNTGYFVMTKTKYDGNLAGTVGANAKCVTELVTTNDWNGKTTANTNGWLNASHIQAFLCNQYMCQNPMPNTAYAFAMAGYTSRGGATLAVDENGAGPNNAHDWAGTNYFGTAQAYWSGRDSGGTDTVWDYDVGSSYDCNGDWSSNSGAGYGVVGYTHLTDAKRFVAYNSICSATHSLICMVHP